MNDCCKCILKQSACPYGPVDELVLAALHIGTGRREVGREGERGREVK